MAGTITRGKVIRADLAQWDGKTATHTRIDATGGTLTGLAVGNEVDVLQAYGSGADRTRATVAAAANYINTSNVTLVFAPGTWTIDSSLTVGANFTCHIPAGCVFSVDSGQTLTFSGDVHVEDPENWYTGSGTVIVSREGCHGGVWHRTATERSASVTPTNFSYPPGDIRRYGATSGGSAATNTTAVQAAIDSNYNVYVPPGTYSCNTVTLRAGVRIYGDGAQSILSQNTITDGSYGTLYANSGASGSTVDDILIERLQVLGAVSASGFSEHQHLISLNGVSRVTIRNCLIKGFRGDGIYIGSGVIAGDERHNARIKILNNVIDGVNNDNRNGISIVDCDDGLIEGNTFVNCTRSNMPGAVDIEPDAQVFHITRNIRVLNNHFVSCGGNVAQIALVLGGTTFTVQPENFKFNGNSFVSTANGFVVNNSVTSYARPLKIEFCNNSGTVADPWQVFSYVDGLIIKNNQLRFTGDPVFSADTNDIVIDLIMEGNILTGDGVTTGIVLRGGNGIEINNNIFAGCAGYAILLGGSGATLNEVGIAHNSMLSTVQIGVQFGGGTVTNARILDNDFSRVSTGAFSGTIPTDTRIRGNKGYVSEGFGVTSAIATGTTVSHGCGDTPTVVLVTALDAGPTDIYVTSIGSSTFTINYGGGGTHVFAWQALTSYHYAS